MKRSAAAPGTRRRLHARCDDSLLTFNAGMYFATGESPKRRGNVHPTISPYETFEAGDGWLNVALPTTSGRCSATSSNARKSKTMPVSTRPRNVPRTAPRCRHPATDLPVAARDHWLHVLGKAGIRAGDQDGRRGAPTGRARHVQSVAHKVAGDACSVARPLRFDDLPPASIPPPMLGEHTAEVFEDWLGWTRESRRNASKGAFGGPRRSSRPSSGHDGGSKSRCAICGRVRRQLACKTTNGPPKRPVYNSLL